MTAAANFSDDPMDLALTSVTEAAGALRALLSLPDERPGCWEAEHVEALEEHLAEIVDTLTGAAEGGDSR